MEHYRILLVILWNVLEYCWILQGILWIITEYYRIFQGILRNMTDFYWICINIWIEIIMMPWRWGYLYWYIDILVYVNLYTQMWMFWYWCANVYGLESQRSGKPSLFSSAIDENNLGRPPRPGDLLHRAQPYNAAPNVGRSGDRVRCVAIFGPKGAGNCVNQRGQIMLPHWLTPPVQEDTVSKDTVDTQKDTVQGDTVYIRCQQCGGEWASESPPSLLICNYWQLVELRPEISIKWAHWSV